MKVKKLLKFYFNAGRAEKLIDRLIYKKATSVNFARPADDCAEEVAELVKKKAEMCAFYGFLKGAVSAFSEEEMKELKRYSVSGSAAFGKDEGRAVRRLALKLARRLKGCSEKYSEGIAAAFDLSFMG